MHFDVSDTQFPANSNRLSAAYACVTEVVRTISR
jgi:hypothetical protein